MSPSSHVSNLLPRSSAASLVILRVSNTDHCFLSPVFPHLSVEEKLSWPHVQFFIIAHVHILAQWLHVKTHVRALGEQQGRFRSPRALIQLSIFLKQWENKVGVNTQGLIGLGDCVI